MSIVDIGGCDAIGKMWHLLQSQTVALTNCPAMKKGRINQPAK